MLIGVAIVAALGLFTIPFYGRLSDRVGRKPLYMTGAVVSLICAFPFVPAGRHEVADPHLGRDVLGVNVGHDLMYGPQGAYFAELFGTRYRYSGASLGYQLASVFAGGFAPLIAAALLTAGGDRPWLVALYMAALSIDHDRRHRVRARDLPRPDRRGARHRADPALRARDRPRDAAGALVRREFRAAPSRRLRCARRCARA